MVKMVSLSNKAYEELKNRKNKNESFSDVILKLINNNNKNIDKFAGIFKFESKYLEKIGNEIINDRKSNYGRLK